MKRYLWSATRLLAVLSVSLAVLGGTSLHLAPLSATSAFADDDNEKKKNNATAEFNEAGVNNNVDRVGGPSGSSDETITNGTVRALNTLADPPYVTFSTVDCDVKGWLMGQPARSEVRELRIGRYMVFEGPKINECERVINSYRGGND